MMVTDDDRPCNGYEIYDTELKEMVVTESGVLIWSASEEAIQEFTDFLNKRKKGDSHWGIARRFFLPARKLKRKRLVHCRISDVDLGHLKKDLDLNELKKMKRE